MEDDISHIHEFTLTKARWAEKMSDLTVEEINLVYQLLKYIDLFNAENQDLFSIDYDWHSDQICVIHWAWTHDNVTDELIYISGWPGDNEDGGVFLNGVLVLLTGDGEMVPTDDAPNSLAAAAESLNHLRVSCIPNCHDLHGHEHCCQQYLNYVKALNTDSKYHTLYLKEFRFIRTRQVQQMLDLDSLEIDLVQKFLQSEDYSEVSDFFNNEEWSTDKLRITYWYWNWQVLIDISGLPNNQEHGAIFLNNQIILYNENGVLSLSSNTPIYFYRSIISLQYLRSKLEFPYDMTNKLV